ncbi:14354_t:CDS:10 [Cetraspora pellucida]|uniref:Pheromone-processing carboxypeptidase KEX1 n=1 Tax=Cetraspora pellucida TaxID=1433469 RepID=A0A9N9HM41_9GLOM|nr:14354_t:CDS:10 [Cetraspora pellucida]
MKYILKSLILALGFAFAFLKTTSAAGAADHFVRTLPGLPDDANLKQHAGHITIDESTNSNIFFWLMHNRHISDKSRLIIWLNGGPGCSSMDGVFLENGPWRINSDQTLKMIDGSWIEFANVLYVDQPVGTGFSYVNATGYLRNVSQVPGQFLTFLDKFFEIFPEFSKDDMYLAGESFAGTFIPYIAAGILKRNNETTTTFDNYYNLKGIAIGNGWIDPIPQKTAESQLASCMAAENQSFTIHQDMCEELLMTILRSSRTVVGKKVTCLNQYDIRDYKDTYPSCGLGWPYELPTIYEYLKRADVLKAIHAEGKTDDWVECSPSVSRGFTNDPSPPSVLLLPSILKQINVLFGDQDLICNHDGTEAMIKELEWNDAKGFQNSTTTPLSLNNTVYGHMISERNLTYIVIYNASHMVPYDVPVQSMDMMYRFMGVKPQTIMFPSGTTYNINFESTVTSNTPIPPSAKIVPHEILDQYYNAGTITLIIVICGVVSLAAFLYRGRLKRKRNISQTMKAVVESSNNEMDELVIETPLFQSDNVDNFGDSEDEESRMHNNQDRYVD